MQTVSDLEGYNTWIDGCTNWKKQQQQKKHLKYVILETGCYWALGY